MAQGSTHKPESNGSLAFALYSFGVAWTIDFQGTSFTYASYVYFLGQVERARERGEARIEVSFDSIEFFYPDGMAPFVAAVMHFVNSGLSVGVGRPRTTAQLEYWSSVGWLDGLQGVPPVRRRGGTYVPLTPYRNAEDLHVFLNYALDVLTETQSFPEGVLTAFEWSFYEVSDNVLVHADSQEPGWLQLTSYRDSQRVEFVVVDTGRGIRASLSEAISDLSSDEGAIAVAVEKGTTRDREVGQGNGLSGTLRIASGAKGWMNIHSGNGQLRWMEDKLHLASTSHHPGTLVTVTLPTRDPIDVSEALWGHVPVPAFETQYVTDQGIRFVLGSEATNFGNRSTGERLRLKLKNLADLHTKEAVVVDFKGVDVMSASFADEFIAKLVKELGPTRFFGRYRFVNLSGFAATTVDQVITQRLGS